MLYGGRLGTSLYELGFITEERLRRPSPGPRRARPRGPRGRSQPEAVALVPKKLGAALQGLPLPAAGQDPLPPDGGPGRPPAVAKVGYSLGYIVKPLVVPEFRMIQLLRDHYGVDERWRYTDTHRPAPRRAARSGDPRPPPRASTPPPPATRWWRRCSRSCQCFFRRVVFFIVREPWVLGWDGRGRGHGPAAWPPRLRIPLDQPSVFQDGDPRQDVFIGRLRARGREPSGSSRRIGKKARHQRRGLPDRGEGPGRQPHLRGQRAAGGRAAATWASCWPSVQKVPRAYLRIIRAPDRGEPRRRRPSPAPRRREEESE